MLFYCFIAPLADTIVDFLRMIWQESIQTIVMLTNLNENGISKCEQYWPLLVAHEKSFDPFSITLESERTLLDYVIRTFVIKVSYYHCIYIIFLFS